MDGFHRPDRARLTVEDPAAAPSASERLAIRDRSAGSAEETCRSRREQDEWALRRVRPLLDRERKHVAVTHDRPADKSAIRAGHSRPDDRRLLAVAKPKMSRGRFGVIQWPANQACLRIDQRHNRALPEGRGDFELRLAAARERGKASLVGGPADAIERDAGSLFGAGG